MTKTVGIIQVRLDSTRLPKKALKEIVGKPMITHLIERIKQSKKLDEIIVATTEDKSDDEVVNVIGKLNIPTFRGSYEDVLDRYFQAAKKYDADVIVRITGDCPLIDPDVVDEIIEYFNNHDFDYVSNTIKPTYPDGLCVEVFSFKALEKAWNQAELLSEREHVTPYITKHPEIFKIKNIENSVDLSDLRWCVDQQEDLDFVKEVFKSLYNKDYVFHMEEILELLDKNPDLKKINTGIQRNEGYIKSLKEDRKIKKG